jgi:hypothetical protein
MDVFGVEIAKIWGAYFKFRRFYDTAYTHFDQRRASSRSDSTSPARSATSACVAVGMGCGNLVFGLAGLLSFGHLPHRGAVQTKEDAMALSEYRSRCYVDPVTREAVDLMHECDRVDSMPGGKRREQALMDLISRVELFESVLVPVKRSVLRGIVKAL